MSFPIGEYSAYKRNIGSKFKVSRFKNF